MGAEVRVGEGVVRWSHARTGEVSVSQRPSHEAGEGPGADERDATAGLVWPAARPLCAMLCGGGVDLAGKSVVEVGCGPALPGIAAARLGAARVVLCDKPSELALPRENAARNGVRVEVMPCWWGDHAMLEAMGQFDVVIVSDWYARALRSPRPRRARRRGQGPRRGYVFRILSLFRHDLGIWTSFVVEH